MTTIAIRYAAVPNRRPTLGARTVDGWAPFVAVNGRRITEPYLVTGLEESVALEMAKHEAEGEAARYVGDWDVTVRELS